MRDSDAYQEICEVLYSLSGIRMSPEKRSLVESRLMKRMQFLGVSNLSDYLPFLEEPEERLELVEALTTHKTEWFRESVHYEFLEREVSGWQRGAPFYFWSAACSTGEELYSAAMILLEKGLEPRLLGTDISEKVVREATKGEFSSLRKPPLTPRTRPYLESNGSEIRVNASIRGRTKFRVQNLQEVSLPGSLRFDAIFLRNVLIYFSSTTQESAIRNVLRYLKPGGLFAIGLSESLRKNYEELESLGPSIYRKKAS